MWIELILLMREATPAGYLVDTDGTPLDVDTISRLTALTTSEVARGMRELELRGVLSKDMSGTYYCRKIARPEDQVRAMSVPQSGPTAVPATADSISSGDVTPDRAALLGATPSVSVSGIGISSSEDPGTESRSIATTTGTEPAPSRNPRVVPAPDPRRLLLDHYESALLQHRGIVCRPAASKVHLGVAGEVLETCRGDLEEAKALADLYVRLDSDRWVAEQRWPFRWLATRLPLLTAERSKRREPPRVAKIRAALDDLSALAEQGADVGEEIEGLRRELEQAQGYR